MKKILRRAIVLTAAVVAPASVLPATAWSTSPDGPTVGLSTPDTAILFGGQPGEVDLKVSDATTKDAYLRVDFQGQADALRVTDDAGNTLPMKLTVEGTTTYGGTIDVGAADTDGNGIPGAPLANGTVHLHVAATKPVTYTTMRAVAYAVDGATGKGMGQVTLPHGAPLYFASPFTQTWQGPGSNGTSGHDLPMPIIGGPEATTLNLSGGGQFSHSPDSTTTRLVLPAAQLTAAGYSPEQFAAQVQVSYSTDGLQQTPLIWTVRPDGALELDLPAMSVPVGAPAGHQQLRFHAPWNITHGYLTADLTLSAADGTVLGTTTRLLLINPGPAPITYHPLNPTRILDTRNRTGVPGTVPLAPGATLTLTVGGTHGVPANATAAVLNVTATAPAKPGFLAVHPAATEVTGSSLNWTPGQTVANQVITPIRGTRILFTNHSAGTVHIVADLQGYYAGTAPQGSGYTPLTPTRILDTRNASGTTGRPAPVPASGSITLTVPGLPSTATAVTMNLTATAPTAPGFASVYPLGHTEPTASSLNWASGQTIPNLVTVPVTDGKVVLHNRSTGTVHFIADVEGFFSTAPDANAFLPLTPTRVLDTRNRTGVPGTVPLAPGASITLPLADLGLDHTTYGRSPVNAVALNVTATAPTAAGFLSVQPAGTTTTASNLNWTRGQTIANLVTVPTTNGSITLTNHSTGTVHLIADASGTYTY